MSVEIIGLAEVIKELDTFVDRLPNMQREFLTRLAQIGIETATTTFSTATYAGTNDVTVMPTPRWVSDNTLEVVASGYAVLFIEFGTGVHYTEQHPNASEFGFIRGGYGKGMGRRDSWYYKGDPGNEGEVRGDYVKTHGNPPAMAMYKAREDMLNRISEIAKEVFQP